MTPQLLNTIGLVFDIAGVWFLAYEVIKKFASSEFERSLLPASKVLSPPSPKKSEAFQCWQQRRGRIGLGFLTLGFGLQILSNWIR